MSGIRTTERRSQHSCTCDGCRERIPAGATYLEHKVPPRYRSLGNADWLTKRECLACAGRLGRRADQPPEDFMVPLFDAEPVA